MMLQRERLDPKKYARKILRLLHRVKIVAEVFFPYSVKANCSQYWCYLTLSICLHRRLEVYFILPVFSFYVT